MNILVVEDDSDIGAMLSRGLSAEGFDVTVVGRADEALETARQYNPCAVVLDMMLPDGSGIDVCRALRGAGHSGPILFLSAKDEVHDRAEGLGAGADDYIVKPFVFGELVARLRTHLLHRLGESHSDRVMAGRLVLDPSTRTAKFGEVHVRLTEREADLLALLMASPNRPIARGEIFDRLWASQGGASLNVVDVYVGYLRTKLAPVGRAGGPQVATVRGRGFMLDLSAPSAH
ncbi:MULTISPECIES: response regulator transcription factor [Xanthobacter]|jgi:DNA-binding response OmpR family regulator|uniref:Response regulator transcription factor n=1 Tax=Xanthobacter aminoxidans TaxID=186280 RepID=A0ABW6ZJM6_9HYPH|nr:MULTISPECIES: response regulator transcription factor [Xanthobacter]MCL8381540.1 response regulator transcription factor [Xanthobacter aminoxidans]